MTHFLLYLAHYVIARTIYDSLRQHGLSSGALLLLAAIALVVWHAVAWRRWRRRRTTE